MAAAVVAGPVRVGIQSYYDSNIQELSSAIKERKTNMRRLEAQRNELNGKVRLLREELHMLLEPASNCGEVIKAMGTKKVLVKVGQEGKYVVDLDKDIKIEDCKPNTRIALTSDSYVLHKILPSKVDPLVQLMKVEKTPDSTYEMVGGVDKQIKEIKIQNEDMKRKYEDAMEENKKICVATQPTPRLTLWCSVGLELKQSRILCSKNVLTLQQLAPLALALVEVEA